MTKEELLKELLNCRNELCLKCGAYRDSHLGACDGCRYNFENMKKWDAIEERPRKSNSKPKCPNSYNCGDCIHADFVWDGVTFRGIRCLKGCKKGGNNNG